MGSWMYSTIHLLEIMRRSAFKSPLSLHPLRGNPISLVFQNIDPPSPSPPGESVLPPQQRLAGVHTRRAERGMGGSIFWKTRKIGLPSYSKICTLWPVLSRRLRGQVTRRHFWRVFSLYCRTWNKISIASALRLPTSITDQSLLFILLPMVSDIKKNAYKNWCWKR